MRKLYKKDAKNAYLQGDKIEKGFVPTTTSRMITRSRSRLVVEGKGTDLRYGRCSKRILADDV